MIFAELDATGWTVIIAAVFLGLTQVLGMILAYLREQAKIAREELASQKTNAHLQKQDNALDTISRQTNGMMQKIMDSSHATASAATATAVAAAVTASEKNAESKASRLLEIAEVAAAKVLGDAVIAAQRKRDDATIAANEILAEAKRKAADVSTAEAATAALVDQHSAQIAANTKRLADDEERIDRHKINNDLNVQSLHNELRKRGIEPKPVDDSVKP